MLFYSFGTRRVGRKREGRKGVRRGRGRGRGGGGGGGREEEGRIVLDFLRTV